MKKIVMIVMTLITTLVVSACAQTKGLKKIQQHFGESAILEDHEGKKNNILFSDLVGNEVLKKAYKSIVLTPKKSSETNIVNSISFDLEFADFQKNEILTISYRNILEKITSSNVLNNSYQFEKEFYQSIQTTDGREVIKIGFSQVGVFSITNLSIIIAHTSTSSDIKGVFGQVLQIKTGNSVQEKPVSILSDTDFVIYDKLIFASSNDNLIYISKLEFTLEFQEKFYLPSGVNYLTLAVKNDAGVLSSKNVNLIPSAFDDNNKKNITINLKRYESDMDPYYKNNQISITLPFGSQRYKISNFAVTYLINSI